MEMEVWSVYKHKIDEPLVTDCLRTGRKLIEAQGTQGQTFRGTHPVVCSSCVRMGARMDDRADRITVGISRHRV